MALSALSSRRRSHRLPLEAVHFELIGLGNLDPGQELTDVVALVPLQLDHLPILWMFHNCAIAGKLLFAGPHNFLLVIVVGYALYCRKCFTTVALLDSNVD